MGVNGVSHHVVSDDLEGATAVLNWLSTMPPTVGASPTILPTSDPTDRSITYFPLAGESPGHVFVVNRAFFVALFDSAGHREQTVLPVGKKFKWGYTSVTVSIGRVRV